MNILIVNTSERTGGAAVAARRLMEALSNNGEKAMMLVRDKQTDSISVARLPRQRMARWHFLWERLCIYARLGFKRDRLYEIDIANTGTDITRLPEFEWADVVHLHWINQGMLSLANIRKIVKSGKPIVWTMHDLWPAAAICHYARGCSAFTTGCHDCQLLPGHGGKHDLAYSVWKKKKSLYDNANICFVTCSRWLEAQAKRSALLAGQRVVSIPNAIDGHTFRPTDKQQARERMHLPKDKSVILFVSQKVTDTRKGMEYFIEAVDRLAAQHPDLADKAVVAILGGHSDEIAQRLRLQAFPLGYIDNEADIVATYNAADVYVSPSLEDNLPNTIMEALSCGVPCVGFRVGGIPEMIDHRKNGYVAEFKNAADLAQGMYWVLREADHDALSHAATSKCWTNYSRQSVAARYMEVYHERAALKKYIK